ncbi:hypothetical protein ACSQ6I_13525 [Anabaena sp. WFMT]|uniref:hypothetical protein n=1 Tax=Anabaena sp. WFMT TaxID=3449730 RepID=UPI003F2539E0
MIKRDPDKAKITEEINALTKQIRDLEPIVLKLTNSKNIQSLNGKYGGKYAEYIDIQNAVIDTPDKFTALYYEGFKKKLASVKQSVSQSQYPNSYFDNFEYLQKHQEVRTWLSLFLKRTFLRNYDSLSKNKPKPEDSVIWIGQNNASYGLLITPRFKDGQWENDKSEIRHFKQGYWTISHILETGLVIPSLEEKIPFKEINDYLVFFKNVVVRNSGSFHELEIATRYCDFVRNAEKPGNVPLLIPEFRYGGISQKHKYRLDFTIIDPVNMSKVGFELSPWSTHGELTGTKNKTQKEINEEARENFEKEMQKLKSYFREFGITIMVYTDTDLKDYDSIFKDISKYLIPVQTPQQLEFQALADLLAFRPYD